MARLDVSGCDALIAGLEDMAKSAPEIRGKILDAEADVIEPAIRESIRSENLIRSGKLLQSITRRKATSAGLPIIRIGPTGEHHRYLPSRGKSGIVTAGQVGYIQEYGVPRKNIKARLFLTKALEKSTSAAYDAAEKVYNDYLKTKNL